MKPKLRRAALAVGAAAACTLFVLSVHTPSALASNASVAESALIYSAEPGESNSVTVWIDSGDLRIRDTGAAIQAGAGCIALSASDARCPGVVGVLVALGDGPDSIDLSGAGVLAFADVDGGEGDDTIIGSSSSDNLYGHDGNDRIFGGGGSDNIDGGTGDDAHDGGAGGDNLYGGDGRDALEGGTDSDNLEGGAGADLLRGGAGSDNLFGGGGNDVVDSLDGESDNVSCGAETDDVSADVDDNIASDCEYVSIAPPPPPAGKLRYVILGDSFASGEGAYSYDDGESCHRSPLAWGSVVDALAAQMELVANLACSGARISHLLNQPYRGELPQVEQLRLLASSQPIDLVLLAIGGNNLNFGREVTKCFVQNGPFPLGPFSCVDDLQRTDDNVPRVASMISNSLIPALQLASGATVVLVGYPRIFPELQTEATTCGWLSGLEMQQANTVATTLTREWRAAALQSGALFVDSTDAFDGRELCVDSASWFNPILGKPTRYAPEQGHPTEDGYAAWGAWIYEELRALGLAVG